MQIFNNEQATISFDKDNSCIIWTPEGYLKDEVFTKPFEAGLDFIERKNVEQPVINWLNDTRKLRMVSVHDVNWLNKNVNDRAYLLGTKRVAFVLPESYYGKLAIKVYLKFTLARRDNNLEIKIFNSIVKAKQWLKGGFSSGEIQFL